MILLETMRSDMPVQMEHFLDVGRRLEGVRKKLDFRAKVAASSESACAERFFLEELDPGQKEHFLDFVFVNSTCRALRAAGKRAFFAGKIFVIGPPFLRKLCGATPRLGAENLEIAKACIGHVIAPIPNVGSPCEFITLPRYHALQRLRTLNIRTGCWDMVVFSSVNEPTIQRHALPEELLGLLGGIGVRVDRLEIDIQYDTEDSGEKHHQLQMGLLPTRIYPILRLLAARRATGRFQISAGKRNGT